MKNANEENTKRKLRSGKPEGGRPKERSHNAECWKLQSGKLAAARQKAGAHKVESRSLQGGKPEALRRKAGARKNAEKDKIQK